jgi:uncharacterized DUF497 family protein
MLPDSLRGHGAFRCGCGVRIKLTIQGRPTCGAAADEAGRACRFAPVRESAEYGLFLCNGHLAGHEQRIEEIKSAAVEEASFVSYQDQEREVIRDHTREQRERREIVVDRARERGTVVVYYIRIGDYIKIGTTADLAQRMSVLQPDEILATEPGYLEIEKKRHEQFRHLRIRPRSERHRIAPDLLDHIEMILDLYGPPRGQFDTPEMPEAS